ncbi:MAG: transposase [Chloroflexota bacterium]|nr:transposase [Chloroflexota bacterium]
MDTSPLAALRAFRRDLSSCFSRRADAVLESVDAILAAEAIPSLPRLSLAPLHRRGWGSVYAALAEGRLDAERVRAAVAAHPLEGGQPIYAVDVSVWPRCDAEASPERGYSDHPSRHSAGQPIVAGWAYQWVAPLSFERDSWTAPVDAQRVRPTENANAVAVQQITALAQRRSASDDVPLFVFDGGYDSAQLTQGLTEMPVAILVRLRSDRCFDADPPPAVPSPKGGRPRGHGAKFNRKDPTTWPLPTAEHVTEDAQYGTVQAQAWSGLHPKQQAHAIRGTRRPRPIVRGTLIRVEVARLPGRSDKPEVLRLWWAGSGAPDLDTLWRAYVRRFDLEHTLRFLKQSRGWTTPRVRHPAQADRWTWLVVAAYTQLRLVRPLVADRRLPWERPLPQTKLTPSRVRRTVSAALLSTGTPATAPKPCGRSPGRPNGSCSGRAPRYPAVKKVA